jgi:hypothetical protein
MMSRAARTFDAAALDVDDCAGTFLPLPAYSHLFFQSWTVGLIRTALACPIFEQWYLDNQQKSKPSIS